MIENKQTSIHPSAVVEPGARLGEGVKVGPFCFVGSNVELAAGTELVSHATVVGRTAIGERTRIFPFASIGHPPQDVKYKGEDSTLLIGADCTIREGVTMNPGTAHGRMTTIIGNNCLFLANSHVAHDCEIGNHVIFSNNVLPAGHCYIGDYVIVGGGAGIHQFVRIGHHAFIGGMSAIEHDVIPFGMAMGNRAYLAGLNIIGLKRRNFSREQIHELRRVYRALFANEGTLSERVEDVAEEFAGHDIVHEILDFIRASKDRAICTPRDAGSSNA